MKKKLLMLVFAMAAMTASAQTVIFDGESGSKDPWWDDASATIADNPTKDGINTSGKCLQITANNGQKCAKLGMGGTSLNGMRRISFMIKMSESGNVKVKLIKDGDGAYSLSRAVWYDGNGAWQKKTVLFPETSVVDANTCIELFPHDNESYDGDLVAYIDNVQLEGAIVGGAGIDGMADNTISAEAKITGILAKGTNVCSDLDHGWNPLSYDDYVKMNSKFSSNITSVDITEATISDFDADQFFYKNVNNVLYAPTGTSGSHANVVVDGACGNLNLNAGYAFNAPSGFTVTGSVNIFRTTRAGINSFCLPVEVSEGDLMFKDADPDPLANYLATYKETGTNVVFTKHATVAANTPFILDSKYAVTETNLNNDGYYITIDCSVNNKTVVATPNSLGAGFVGVYVPLGAGEVTDKWGIADSGKLQPGSSTATIKAFHAYLSGEVGARASMISFDDEDVTGINEIERMRNVENEKFYNLNGQQVAQPTRGLYIVNGKKVVIK